MFPWCLKCFGCVLNLKTNANSHFSRFHVEPRCMFLFINQHTQTAGRFEEWKPCHVRNKGPHHSLALSSSFSIQLCPHSRFSQMFLSFITFPSPHFISALPFHSLCTPSPCVVSVFPHPSLSQLAICWRWQITAALWNHSWWHWTRFIWHSDDVRPGTAWPRHCKNTTVLERSWALVSATACFNYSWQRHTWKCQCLCVISSNSWINSCSPSWMEKHLHAAE